MSDSWGRLWDPYIDTAIGAWDRGDKARTDKIIRLLVQVMKQGQQYNTVDDKLVNGLYTVAEHMGADSDFSRAEWIYLSILESQEETLGPDDPQALQTLLKLSALVMASGAKPDRPGGNDHNFAC